MLVLSRKSEQQIAIGSDIVVTVVAVHGNRVTLGIEAPRDVRVLRGELLTDQQADLAAVIPVPSKSPIGTDLGDESTFRDMCVAI